MIRHSGVRRLNDAAEDGRGFDMSMETGIVEKIENDIVWVKARRKSACSGCATRDHCSSLGSNHMLMQAKNSAGARTGDEVQVHLKTAVKMKCLFYLYIVPVLGLMAGAFSSESLSGLLGLNPKLGMVLFTVGGVALSYYLVRIYSNHLEAKGALLPEVMRIIRKAA